MTCLFGCLYLRLLGVFVLFLPSLSESSYNEKKNILIFGGNGLLGGHTTRRLHSAGHRLTVISRGSNYWDWSTLLKGHAEHVVKCDRFNPLYLCDDFVKLANSKPQFDILIDFSGFSPSMLYNILGDISSMIKYYIFISTDSVYEVSANKTHNGYTKEGDAVRPADILERINLARKDHYGENKYRCEEALRHFSADNNINALSIRLPDVLGPRDSTSRYFGYIVALEIAEATGQDLKLPTFAPYWEMSFVYADDVARLLTKIAGEKIIPPTKGGKLEAVNFGSPVTLTLEKLLRKTSKLINLKSEVKFTYPKNTEVSAPQYLIPSVTRGAIDVSLSLSKWNFSYTPWDSALTTTTRFYQHQLKKIRSKRLFEDDVTQRLYGNLKHLTGLDKLDDRMWKDYLNGNLRHKHKRTDL